MSDVLLLERLRAARRRRAVVKTRFITLRGRCGNAPILAFEGDDDKTVYGRWIGRLRDDLRYEVFVCDGKRGVIELKNMLDEDVGELAQNVYYFVDRDFDDLAEFVNPDSMIFMTDSYSFENYIVSETVLERVLRDDFPLHEAPHVRTEIIGIFREDYGRFLSFSGPFNWRLFCARRLKIRLAEKPPSKPSSVAEVAVGNTRPSRSRVEDLVKLEREPSDDETRELADAFAILDPAMRYRGKNALAFFIKWLSELADECRLRETSLFDDCAVGTIKHAEFGIGGLASKSIMPDALYPFVEKIAA